MLFNPKYGLVFSFPGLDLSFPVALIKDLIMTDCSCEGFTKIVKAGWLEGVFFFRFFFFLQRRAEAKRERERVKRLNGKSSGACHILSQFGL